MYRLSLQNWVFHGVKVLKRNLGLFLLSINIFLHWVPEVTDFDPPAFTIPDLDNPMEFVSVEGPVIMNWLKSKRSCMIKFWFLNLKISKELSNYLTNVRATFANSKLASARLSSRWFEIGTIFRRRGSAWGGDCGTYQKINSRESILNLKCFFYLQVQHTPKLDIHPPSAVPPFAVHSAAV